MHITEIALQPAELRLLRWLGLAVLLHVALLLVPVGDPDRSGGPAHALSIRLLGPSHAEPARSISEHAPAARAEPTQRHAEPPPAPSSPSAAGTPDEKTAVPKSAPARARTPPTPELSAARLIELARQRESALQRRSANRELGVFVPQPPPDNWRPGKALGESRFDGRSLPDEVAIRDRWLAVDGRHNVLLETPGGDLLCGRAESWDPMRPLVEHVMMFRSCGPGTRTFEWPEYYRASAVQPSEPTRAR